MNLRAPNVTCVSLLLLAGLALGGCNRESVIFAEKDALRREQEAAAQAVPPPTPPKRVALRSMPAPEPAPSWAQEATSAALTRPLPADAEALTMSAPAAMFDEPLPGAQPFGPTDDEGAFERVTTGDVGADFDPAISRDGGFMVFASTRHRATSDLYFKRTGSSSVTQLTSDAANDVMPAISPDGSRIAFASDRRGAWNIFVMSTQGGPAVQLTFERAADLHPSWSPDGSKLVFSRLGSRTGQWELWVIDAKNPQTPEFIGYGLLPEWSPVAGTGEGGADRIVFQRARQRGDRAYSVWTVDYKPGHAMMPTEIVPARDTAAINPSWSPDGRWIAYVSALVAEPAPGELNVRPTRAEVWLAAADGSSKVALTAGPYRSMSPAWGGSGELYFVSDRSGQDSIWAGATAPAIALAKGELPARPVAAAPAKPAPAAVAQASEAPEAQPAPAEGEMTTAPEAKP